MMKTLVMKFGGTSVGSAEAIRSTAEIIRAARIDWPRLVVVVSALSGVTDALLEAARLAVSGDEEMLQSIVDRLRAKHLDALDALLPAGDHGATRAAIESYLIEFETLCQAVSVLGEAPPRALDAITSLGERLNAQIVAAYLGSIGLKAQPIEATQLIVTDDHYQSANPMMEATCIKTQARLNPLLDSGAIPVVTGFIGATVQGVITTLGRGGSDFSAAILGVALEADEVWIWTDVDGIMTTDPRIVSTARTLPELTFREVSELAFYGAKVLHPKTIRPVIESGITLRVKNTFNPTHPGTRIVSDRESISGVIKAVTVIRGQTLLTLEGRGMLGVPGVVARAFGAIARMHISVSLITQASSEQSICFSVPASVTAIALTVLREEFQRELDRRDIDDVLALQDVAIITVVGAGMRHTPGIAGQVFSALGVERINVIAIAQGSSECSISLIVEALEADRAVTAIHALISAQSSIANSVELERNLA
jgi:bifunctional aspartokinase / homoserine dehydrogenase 1